MTKQGSVVRTTWSHNSLVSPRCTRAQLLKDRKKRLESTLAFLIESFHGVVRIQRRISRFISTFVRAFSRCWGMDLRKDFNYVVAAFNGVVLKGVGNCWTCLS
ncbi:hypothetical protein CDAR_171501 [Caerostris darwini]|uniref:Uncharacterized protein n=1 Tax=Caerostris darwini TaxID=1538125 RepID=A0AAV4WPF9_9ARAC|nr:hypothetical protein CDAR_171501 [Caerostris darwini]